MTQQEFKKIATEVASEFLPTVSRPVLREYVFTLIEELNAAGLDLEEDGEPDDETEVAE